jgi:pilus assembly protein CpaF
MNRTAGDLSLLGEEKYGPLLKYIRNPLITDIDYNGRALWVKDIHNIRSRIDDGAVTQEFIRCFITQVANVVSKPFNKQFKVLEAETDALRITCIHEEAALSGRCLCIRKTTKHPRLNFEKVLAEKYCEEEVLHLLVNCVIAKMNFVICGEPSAGKTEYAKFLSLFIPDNEKVITIEDAAEWHYQSLKPKADCIELRVCAAEGFDYTDALKECMRLNPDRVMLSEVRSVEAKALIECWSSGVKGITTLHTDDVRKIPDRILNMMPSRLDAERLNANVYEYLDVGILLKVRNLSQGEGMRYLAQVYFFLRDEEGNRAVPIVVDGKLCTKTLPQPVMKRLAEAQVTNPFGLFPEWKKRGCVCADG